LLFITILFVIASSTKAPDVEEIINLILIEKKHPLAVHVAQNRRRAPQSMKMGFFNG
jgi:hypothetical protein